MREDAKPVWKILVRRGWPYIEDRDLPNTLREYTEVVTDTGGAVIGAPPGSGKSRDASEFVAQAWKKKGIKGLYLMLSHSAIDARLKSIRKDGNADLWEHWKRHDPGCERDTNNGLGYLGYGPCHCGLGERKAQGPTLAPIEHILPSLPDSESPMTKAVLKFNFWVIDEMDFRRLVECKVVSHKELGQAAESYPDKAVKTLCSALGEAMGQLKRGETMSGDDLYTWLFRWSESQNGSLIDLIKRLRKAKLKSTPWTDKDEDSLPQNFPPVLVPVFLEEIDLWARQRPFNPRIHIIHNSREPQLKVWWRKELYYDRQQGFGHPHTFILDATADSNLLNEVFQFDHIDSIDPPEWPDNVYVHQWVDNTVTRQTLSIPEGSKRVDPRSKRHRQIWYNRIAAALSDIPRDWPIGLVTHQAIEQETKGELQAMGFNEVCSLHYGDDRGSNDLEEMRVLLLLGLPIPPPKEFKEEAQAFLCNGGPLEFTWERKTQYIEMRDEGRVPVNIGGIWTDPVASYHRQKCQFGLYQALNRVRPYRPRDYDRHIFIFTNMPVPGVKIDYILRDKKKEELVSRFERAKSLIIDHTASQGVCTVPELAELLAAEGETKRSISKWIQNNAESIAQGTGTRYEARRGRQGSRFNATGA